MQAALRVSPSRLGEKRRLVGANSHPGTRSSWTRVADGGAWGTRGGERSALGQQASATPGVIGSGQAPPALTADPGSANGPAVTIGNGATVEIDGPSDQSVTFAGTTGTLKLQDAVLFTGLISGLSGADAIDLSDFAYGANVTATYLGNDAGGTLTVTDARQDGANRALR